VNLDTRACNTMLVWAADYHSRSIMNTYWKPLQTLFMQCYQHFGYNGDRYLTITLLLFHKAELNL